MLILLYIFLSLVGAVILPISLYVLAEVVRGLFEGVISRGLLTGFLAVSLMPVLLAAAIGITAGHLEARAGHSLKSGFIRKCQRLEFHHFESSDSLDTINLAKEAAGGQAFAVFRSLISLVSGFIQLAGLVYIFIGVHPAWAALYILLLILTIFLDAKAIKMMNQMFEGSQISERRFNHFEEAVSDPSITGYLSVIGGFKFIRKKIICLAQILLKERVGTTVKAQKYSIISRVVIFLWYGASFAVLTLATFRGEISVGVFVAVTSALAAAVTVSELISVELSNVQLDGFYIEKYSQFMDLSEADTVADTEADYGSTKDSISTVATEGSPFIEFKDVWFKYPASSSAEEGADEGEENPHVLRGVSFKLSKTGRTALVGENGCGKSTIIKLILRLYKPDSGSIYCCGRNIESISKESLRGLISAVFQDFAKFQMTLGEIIGLRDLSEIEASGEERMLSALKFAGAQDLGDLSTSIGRFSEDDRELSEGEWQKLSVARAVAREAAYYLFDEPLSSADPITEHQAYQNLARITENKGALFISHRLRSASGANKILLLHEGVVHEEGDHKSLMQKNGLYRQMYDAQTSWYEEA